MRKFLLLLGCIALTKLAESQDFSNKGKDFWAGYGSHCDMYNVSGAPDPAGGGQEMVLYFATEALTTVTVSIPSIGWTQTYPNIAANTIYETPALPKTGANDARLSTEGILNRGIHITSDKPIVAYEHIYNGSRSGATLLFPTNTLGKEYYSLNMTQNSQQAYSYCYFFVVATDTGTTTVQVTPSANTQTMTAGNTYTYNLTQGQVFNALGTITGNNGVDLTGSKIVSVASGTGKCKPVAVFSGSGKINLACPSAPGGASADNYIVQSFPKTAWGKNYLTVPTAAMPNNYYRVAVSDPATVVKLNGTVLTGLINGFYYQFGATTLPNFIEADKPIMVAQYITSTNQCGNPVGIAGGLGDPEVIYLSSIEQNIDKVLLYSTPHAAITNHYVSVLIPNGGTAISSFRIDGAPPSSSFTVHPQNSNYSYLQQSVSVGTHTISSDSGFNASAYGYGNVESYGYNAGTNVKDLYTFITPINPLSISTNVTACTGTPFYFSITLPKHPDSLTYIAWDYHNAMGFVNDTMVAPLTADTNYFIGGVHVWRYRNPTLRQYSPAGIYPVTITLGTLTAEGCGNSVTIDRDLYVYDPPILGFKGINNGCVTDSVAFTDTTSYPAGTFAYKWWWDFGDGNFSILKNPKHKYSAPGTYTVRYSTVTNVGCLSDTATRIISITNVPVPKFGNTFPVCDGMPVTFTDSSQLTGPGNIQNWFWDFGDGSPINTLQNPPPHIYSPWGNKTVKLHVQSNTGCMSNDTSKQIYVGPIPFVNFTSQAVVCLPYDSAHFNSTSTIADNSQAGFGYKWHFGDPGSGPNDSAAIKNPAHLYSATGSYPVQLIVTSNAGCVHDTIIPFSNLFAQAHADFSVLPENCFNTPTTFTSNATGSGAAIQTYFWDFGDGSPISNTQNPSHTYATTGTKTIKHWIITTNNCKSDTTTKTVIIHPLPTANFNSSIPSCQTGLISFTDLSVPNVGSLTTWSWDFADGSPLDPNQNPTHVFSAAGTYGVTLTVTNSKGCVSTPFTKQVTVNPRPLAGFIIPEVCLSDTYAQFIDTSKVASGTIQAWNWDFGDPGSGAANTSTLRNPQHSYTAVGPYSVRLIVTTNSNCKDTITQGIFVNGSFPNANFNVLNPALLCANDSVAIVNTSTVFPGTITKVEIYWDNINQPAVGDTDNFPVPGKIYKHRYPNFQSPLTKTFTIRFRAYSGGICLDDTLSTITVNAAPKVQFNPLPSICSDAAPYQITQASDIGAVPGAGVFSGPGVTPGGLFNPALVGPGTYIITYTYTSAAGSCVDTASRPITVWQPPIAHFGYSNPNCEKNTITFTDSSSTTVGTLQQWRWDFGDGTPVVINNSPAPVPHTFANWGPYNVTLTVTTSNNCKSAPKVIQVMVHPLPKPNFSFEPVLCIPNATAHFTNNTTIADGSINLVTYLWNFGDGSPTQTAVNPAHYYAAPGPYNVRLQATSNNNCVKDTIIVLNTIHPQPKAFFNTNKPSVCLGETMVFTTNSNGADGVVTQWFWNYGDGQSATGSPIVSHIFLDSITYTVSHYIINSFGCNSDTVSKPFTVYPYPTVNAGPDKFVLEGGVVALTPAAFGRQAQYLWTPNLYLQNNNNTILAPIVNGVKDITYTLTVTGDGGCSSSDNVFVKVLKFPVIPNTFTPNNDGINDFWEITYLSSYPGNLVQVFTRTGQLVFESRGYAKPWNGTYNGKTLPMDTYYYIIEPGSGRKPIAGYVTIVK